MPEWVKAYNGSGSGSRPGLGSSPGGGEVVEAVDAGLETVVVFWAGACVGRQLGGGEVDDGLDYVAASGAARLVAAGPARGGLHRSRRSRGWGSRPSRRDFGLGA